MLREAGSEGGGERALLNGESERKLNCESERAKEGIGVNVHTPSLLLFLALLPGSHTDAQERYGVNHTHVSLQQPEHTFTRFIHKSGDVPPLKLLFPSTHPRVLCLWYFHQICFSINNGKMSNPASFVLSAAAFKRQRMFSPRLAVLFRASISFH